MTYEHINRALLTKVRNRIQAEPQRFDMEWVINNDEIDRDGDPDGFRGDCGAVVGHHDELVASCGTSACVAGWAILEGWDADDTNLWVLVRNEQWISAMCRLTGLDEFEAMNLCMLSNWPDWLVDGYSGAQDRDDTHNQAIDAVLLIDLMLAGHDPWGEDVDWPTVHHWQESMR